MEYGLIGLLVGFSLALTGAGGALLSIPLLVYFFDYSIKTSSFYSLIIVSMGALIGLLIERSNIRYLYAFVMALSSILGSFALSEFKSQIPDLYIIYIYYIICTYSLFSVWSKKSISAGESIIEIPYYVLILSGVLLGGLTTLTGLGGGVLLLPLFMKGFRLNERAAVSTSLMTILLTSLISFLLQSKTNSISLTFLDFVYVIVGLFLSVYISRQLILKFTPQLISNLRRVTYSLIVFYTLFNLSVRY